MRQLLLTALLAGSAYAAPLNITPQTQTVEPGALVILTASEVVNWSTNAGTLGSTQGTRVVLETPSAGGTITVTIQDPKDKTRKAFAAINVISPYSGRNIWPLSTIHAGQGFSYAVAKDGTVWGWGNNDRDQIPNSVSQQNLLPQQIEGLKDIKEITSGNYSRDYGYDSIITALSSSGTVWHWGNRTIIPTVIGNGINRIAFGYCMAWFDPQGSLIFDKDKYNLEIAYYASGRANEYGKQGWYAVTRNGDLITGSKDCDYSKISRIPGIKNIISLSFYGSNGSAIAVTREGQGYKVSDGKFTELAGFGDVKAVSANRKIGVLIKNDGKAYVFSVDDDKIISTPRVIDGADRLVNVSVSNTHILALREDGTIFSWGENDFGQLGNGTTEDSGKFTEVIGVKALVP